jgi:predicted Na+-dependent transporter
MEANASAARDRRIYVAVASLALSVFGGLALGAAIGIEGGARSVAIPALALQTFLTVGGIPRRRGSEALREGLVLVLLHYTVATIPLVVLALIVGLDEPLGFGLFLVAIAPPGALIPAFAARLEIDVRSVLVFCLAAYAISLVLTPTLLLLAAGTTLGFSGIATTVGIGLIVPSLLGRLLHEQIVRVPLRVRRGIVNTTVFLICAGLGGELVDGLREADVRPIAFVLVAVVLVLRTFGSGWLTGRLAPPGRATEGAMAGGFKNVALAAAVGGALLGPAAAVPGLLAFFVDTAYFVFLARQVTGTRAGAAAD